MTDTERMKWLNWYVRRVYTIEFTEDLGKVVAWYGWQPADDSVASSSVEDCIDQVAHLHPMP